jgi:hypothetical protein
LDWLQVTQRFPRRALTEEDRSLIEPVAKAKSLESSTWARMELLALANRLLREE